jgi:hypothetical protein
MEAEGGDDERADVGAVDPVGEFAADRPALPASPMSGDHVEDAHLCGETFGKGGPETAVSALQGFPMQVDGAGLSSGARGKAPPLGAVETARCHLDDEGRKSERNLSLLPLVGRGRARRGKRGRNGGRPLPPPERRHSLQKSIPQRPIGGGSGGRSVRGRREALFFSLFVFSPLERVVRLFRLGPAAPRGHRR